MGKIWSSHHIETLKIVITNHLNTRYQYLSNHSKKSYILAKTVIDMMLFLKKVVIKFQNTVNLTPGFSGLFIPTFEVPR